MTSTPSAIAVDAGGSSTRAVVVDHEGNCGAVMRAGPGNPGSDADQAADNIATACAAAMAASPYSPHLVVATVAGILSRGFPELEDALARRGLPTRLMLESDLLSAYFSATANPEGSVMIIGTGAVAGRISGGQLASVRDGLGWLLGDSGSGFWIGRRVARAVAADLDGRGPSTSLTQRVRERVVGIPRRMSVRGAELASLLTWSQSRPPVELARLAVLASEEAGTDVVARDICAQAAAHALTTLDSLSAAQDSPIVLGGGVLDPEGAIGREVHASLHGRALSVADGVAGAALMAVRQLGGGAEEATLARISRDLGRH